MMALTELEVALLHANLKDEALFHTLMRAGFTHLGLTEERVALELGMSRPSVQRWVDGTTAPAEAMRKPVYDWLLAKVRSFERP